MMYSSTSLVHKYPPTVENPFLGLTLFTAVCLIIHFAWLFIDQLRDLGKGGSVSIWIAGQSPYWFTGFHSAAMLVWTYNLIYEDYFSFHQGTYTTQRIRTSFSYARERRFYYQILWITAMAALSMTPDIARLWWSLVCFFPNTIEPLAKGQPMIFEARSSLSIVLSLTSFAILGMSVVWTPFVGALRYEVETCTAEADGKSMQEEELTEWGNIDGWKALEWDPIDTTLVDNRTSDKIKIAILERKAVRQQTTLAAKAEEIKRYRAELESWKDALERAERNNRQERDHLQAESVNYHEILTQLL